MIKKVKKIKYLLGLSTLLLLFMFPRPVSAEIMMQQPVPNVGDYEHYQYITNYNKEHGMTKALTSYGVINLRDKKYKVYVEINNSSSFSQLSNVTAQAVKTWHKNGIPVEVTDNAKDANIFVRAANGTDKDILGVTHYTRGWSYIPVSSVEIVLYPQRFSGPYYIKKHNQCYRITMEHELGHAFGLHHNPDKNSTMHYMYHNEQHLMNSDIDKAKQIYNILANCYQFN